MISNGMDQYLILVILIALAY